MEITVPSFDQDVRAQILKATQADYQWVVDSKQYLFDWTLERYSEVYKLVLMVSPHVIEGLISLDHYESSQRLDINQLEISSVNRGEDKKIKGVAGCLIAFAARQSAILGFHGVVTLEPKYELIDHYRTAYGFEDYGSFMMLPRIRAYLLINKYLDDE